MARGIKGALASVGSTFSNHDAWSIRLVFTAALITILYKAGIPIPHYAASFAVMLGIAALLYEMNAARYALRHYWDGNFFSMVGWSLVWVVAFAYSMNQWLGAASENEGAKSNVHKAAYTQTLDVRASLGTAESDYKTATSRLAILQSTKFNDQPMRSAAAAQADIDNAKAHKFWKSTAECTETKGPQTREFCSKFAAWRGEIAASNEVATLKAEIVPLKQRYDAAQSAASQTKTEVSETRNDHLILTKYAGMKEDDARMFNAVGSIMVISIFLSIATMLREMEHLRQTRTRTPFIDWSLLIARLRSVFDGEDTHTTTRVVEVRRETNANQRGAGSAAYRASQLAGA
jgi:hypothetical protein